MMHYSVQPRDWIFLKGYAFLSFTKDMGKNTGESISKTLSGKCSQKLLDHAKQSATDVLKTASKRVIQKTVIWLAIKLLIKSRKFKKTLEIFQNLAC